jgi:hypothetical protein
MPMAVESLKKIKLLNFLYRLFKQTKQKIFKQTFSIRCLKHFYYNGCLLTGHINILIGQQECMDTN